MALKKAARGVQMDRQKILQDTANPAPKAPEPTPDTEAVVDLRPQTSEETKPRRKSTPATANRATRSDSTPAASKGGGVGLSYSVALTSDQWAWVESEAARRGIAQRYVLLSAVDKHRTAIQEHFRTTVEEGSNLFRWTGEPKDVEGPKVSRSIRFPPGERKILQDLIEEAQAPSMAMYLRIAADIDMNAR